MPTSQDPKSPNPPNDDEEPSFHAHILHGIDPEKEAALVRESREWYKKQYGGTDAALDKAFGLRSRGNATKAGGK